MHMRFLSRPRLCIRLLLLSAAASALLLPSLSHQNNRRPATQRQAVVMNAGDGRPIPELAAVYELEPLMTYDGWERDAKSQESDWVYGSSTAADIKSAVERMRRKQRLHEGDRSDVVLQMLDDATQGFTYDRWERDAKSQESDWVYGGITAAGIESAVERMRRKQRLHDSSLDLFSGTAGARPPQAGFPGLSDGVIRRARACLICLSVFYLGVYSCSALP